MSISSDYTSLTRSTNGMAGMVSGLDTDELVKALLMGQQSKIDKENQSYKLYEYKQDAYRDVISKIDSFKNKFMSYTSSTSLISNSFFNQMTSTTDSSKFKVSGTSSAVDGDMRMKIDQLATTTTLQGGSISAVDKVSGSLDVDKLVASQDYSVSFDFTNDKDVTTRVDLAQTEIDELFDGTKDEIIKKHSDGTEIKFSLDGGKLVVQTDDDIKGKVVGGEDADDDATTGSITTSLGLSKLGLTTSSVTGSFEIENEDGDLVKVNGFNTDIDKDAQPSITISLDGVSKDIKLDSFIKYEADGTTVDRDATIDALGTELNSLFGKDNVKLENNGDGSFSISALSGREIKISGSDDLLDALSLESGATNVLYGGNLASDIFGDAFTKNAAGDLEATININGVDITISETDTITSMIKKVNESDAGVTMSFSSFSSTFKIEANESGAGFAMDFGADNALLNSVMGLSGTDTVAGLADGSVTSTSGASYDVGVNAKFTLNGVTTERGSNKFTIEGISFELTGTHDITDANDYDTIETTRDVDSVMEGITSFVDEYNALIEELNELIGEQYDKEYPPLTDEQKKEMSESEIASWEEKAKTGVLANDDIITDFLSAMRTTMYAATGTEGNSLWQIGIEAGSDHTENGKLYIDTDKLRQSLTENPDMVTDIFAGENGLISKVSSVISTYANTSSGSPGLLVEKAGVKGTATEHNNTLSQWMTQSQSILERLEYNYTMQSDRYWAQFNAMEVVLSNMSSQSAWLSQQFAM